MQFKITHRMIPTGQTILSSYTVEFLSSTDLERCWIIKYSVCHQKVPILT